MLEVGANLIHRNNHIGHQKKNRQFNYLRADTAGRTQDLRICNPTPVNKSERECKRIWLFLTIPLSYASNPR